ncbi:MAG: Holliday junction branch migration protein RuvA, partial [Patescibacteria group bacterium]
MIAYLEGKVISKNKNSVVVLTANGVGYEVFVAPILLTKLQTGDLAKLHTFFQVREDSQDLYGMESKNELDFFKLLISVSGVGPKSALHIMALGDIEEIQNAISKKDLAFLTKVSGIGRKIAERIVVELKDKLATLEKNENHQGTRLGDVMDALTGLGYSVIEASEAIKQI